MSTADRERWESAYGAGAAPHAPVEPRPTIDWIERARTGADVALDLACGHGRHAWPLGRRGYRVAAADISAHALKAIARMKAPAPRPCLVQIDTDAWPFGRSCFDVIVQIDFLDRRLFPLLRDAVKPGGVLLVDTFAGPASDNESGPRRGDFRLEHGELATTFADWEILRCLEEPPPYARSAALVRRPFARNALR